MPYVAVPDHLAGDVFTLANWQTHLEGNLNAGVNRPLYDSGSIGVAASSINITSIPATFAHLLIECYVRGDTAALSAALNLRFNNDSAGNYDFQRSWAINASPGATETYAGLSINVGTIPANTAGANLFGVVTIVIPHYANAANNKACHSQGYMKSGTTANSQQYEADGGSWRSNAAINQITLLPGAGNFQIGSRVTLYGMGYI